ncbi:MAG: SDR family oxidoreductase [Clostridiales bacterium]|nr:SDR family oxidoreductase [Clostridiales bacterium]
MKTAVVTGASRGIGKALAEMLCKNGFAVALIYKSSGEKADALKTELLKSGFVAECYKADVSKSDEVNAVFEKIQKELGTVSVLINNAGISSQSVFTDITDEMWSEMLGINLTGVFNCCRAALPDMIKNHSGVIINIASMWGEVGSSCEVHYSAAKAGVIGLTKALAKEVGVSGIRVNAVSPGVIKTDMLSSFSENDLEELRNETPLMRLGTPEDVANAVEFLISEKASFITGQVLSVNGGFVI